MGYMKIIVDNTSPIGGLVMNGYEEVSQIKLWVHHSVTTVSNGVFHMIL